MPRERILVLVSLVHDKLVIRALDLHEIEPHAARLVARAFDVVSHEIPVLIDTTRRDRRLDNLVDWRKRVELAFMTVIGRPIQQLVVHLPVRQSVALGRILTDTADGTPIHVTD